MTDTPVLFVKPGAVKAADKGRLFKAGIIVVEVEHPSDVNFACASSAMPTQELPHGELLRAFATAACECGQYSALGKAVAVAILNRRAKP